MSGSSAYYLVLFKNSTLIGKGQIDMSHANHSAPVAQEESAGEDGRERAGSELVAAAEWRLWWWRGTVTVALSLLDLSPQLNERVLPSTAGESARRAASAVRARERGKKEAIVGRNEDEQK